MTGDQLISDLTSRPPIRVAVASSGLGHVARGIEAWAADLAAALVRRGIDATLFKGSGQASAAYERVLACWRRNEPATQQFMQRLPRGAWRLGLSSGYDLEQTTFAWHLVGELRRRRIDILHVQDPQLALLVQRAWQLGWLRTRTILGHGTEEPFEFQKKIVFLQHLAPWHLEEARAAGVSRPTWTAIPNFIDTSVSLPGKQSVSLPAAGTASAASWGFRRTAWLCFRWRPSSGHISGSTI